MAEDQDQSQKTEEPTAKRLEEAREKGEVAKSQEVKHWFMILGGALVVTIFASSSSTELARLFRPFLESSDQFSKDPAQIAAVIQPLLERVLAILAVPLSLLVLMAIGGNMIQHLPVLASDRIKPKFNRISPLSGFKRLFSAQNFVEFTKSMVKIIIVGSIVVMLVWPEHDRLGQLMTFAPEEVLKLIRSLSVRMFMGVVAILGFIAGADFLFQRMEFLKRNRMTKQEVKDEQKETEGRPEIRQRIRQAQHDIATQRMLAEVPKADVIATNPQHYAVALRYDAASMRAPRVIARGTDLLALTIRRIGRAHGITVFEHPPLARALYHSTSLGQEISPRLYVAVAQVLTYVYQLTGRTPVKPGARPEPPDIAVDEDLLVPLRERRRAERGLAP